MIHNNKRINNELKKFFDIPLKINLTYYINENNKDILIIFLLYKEKLYKLEFIITKSYPFTPPKVLIKGKKYTDLLQSLSKKIYKDGKTCLCCNSLLCNDSWNPNKNLINIINEIYLNLIIYDEYLEKKRCLKFSKIILKKNLKTANEDILIYLLNYF